MSLSAIAWDLWVGFQVTLVILAASLTCGMIIAFLVSLLSLSRRRFVVGAGNLYVFVFRGSPALIQLYIIYYGLPQLSAVRDSPFIWYFLSSEYICAVLAISLNHSAYTADIMRQAYQLVPKGMLEAGRALGLNGMKGLLLIRLPLSLQYMSRPYFNEVVFTLKATAIVSTISVLDLMGQANKVYFRTFDPFTPLLGAAVFYIAGVGLITIAHRWAEKRIPHG